MAEAFAERVTRLASDGYGLSSCSPLCPERGDGSHAHMTSPDGYDFIARADGTADPYDLTRNSGIAAPVMTPRRAAVAGHGHAEGQAADSLIRDILESLCRRDGLSVDSSVVPGEPARNYELAGRLGIGHVFGLQEQP